MAASDRLLLVDGDYNNLLIRQEEIATRCLTRSLLRSKSDTWVCFCYQKKVVYSDNEVLIGDLIRIK